MSDILDHKHEDYSVSTGVQCPSCDTTLEICAYCNHTWHECTVITPPRNPNIKTGYKVIPEFPEYMVNNQSTVRHIATGKYCMLVRVSKQGGAMINIRKNGKTYTRAAQDLRKAAFGE